MLSFVRKLALTKEWLILKQNLLEIKTLDFADTYDYEFNLGAIFILRKDIVPENGTFPLLYVVKMSLRRWAGGSKKPQNTLT